MIQYEIKVTGRVQGVWYRKFAEEKANELGIKGWVKNTVDGGVLLMAQGEEIELETFIDWLRIGPPLARVNKITKAKMNLLSNFDNFTIQY
ncbi:MAG: acylphosphatase [Bacteroidia bacterium]|nr:acylphosphatase [Bacteroidia bacterium]